MIDTRVPRRQSFNLAALAASRIGTWEYHLAADRFRCDATTATLYGLTPDEAARGVPIARARALVHPDDRVRVTAKREHMQRHGGLYVIEYRTVPAVGEVRWVMARGAYEPDEHGAITCGRGIVIDLTESKLDGYAEGRAHFIVAPVPEVDHINRMADLILAAQHTVTAMDDAGQAELRPLVDMLLLVVGRRIAANMVAANREPDGP